MYLRKIFFQIIISILHIAIMTMIFSAKLKFAGKSLEFPLKLWTLWSLDNTRTLLNVGKQHWWVHIIGKTGRPNA